MSTLRAPIARRRPAKPPQPSLAPDTNHILSINLDDLNMTRRLRNCLHNDAILTIGELASKSETELLRIPNLGRETLEEIIDLLAERGLRLTGGREDNTKPPRVGRLRQLEVEVAELKAAIADASKTDEQTWLAAAAEQNDEISTLEEKYLDELRRRARPR